METNKAEDMEKISILVPCYNVENYVRDCLESIKNQTYTNLEIICIDDGSKDHTGIIIDEYIAKDNRFKAIHKPNSGYGDSMNQGLEMCTGDYVGIIESDDWIEPDMFEILLRTAKDYDLDLTRCTWYEGPTGTENISRQDWVKKNMVCCPFDDESIFLQQPSIWASLYRKDLLEQDRKVRFLPTPGASYQDTSFAFKCYTKSKRFMMIEKPLHHYRINPNSSVMSSGKPYCIVDEWNEMFRWICEDPTIHKKFSQTSLLAKIWHGGLLWNYNRLSTTALKLSFLRKASNMFRQAKANGILNLYEYAKQKGGKTIECITNTPLTYHYNRISERLIFIARYKDYPVKKLEAMDKHDLISVVVTCYNTSKYIYSSLMSVMQQSYRNIEIICVDDCSTDDTARQVHHLMRKDHRITWICTTKNSGLSLTRNLGLQHCKGKYVLFVDGDDCLLPGAIARMYAAMGDNDDVVCGGAIVHYEEGERLYRKDLISSDKKYYTISKNKRINATLDLEDVMNVHASAWGKLWRISVIKDNYILFPNGLLYEDACFYWKYLLMAPNLHIINEPIYLYQRHMKGSIMSATFKKEPKLAIQHIFILDELFQYGRNHHKIQEVKLILSKLYEPYFWFAYKNAPQSDYDAIFTNVCHMIKRQQANVFKSPILKHISRYEEYTKADLFIDAFYGNEETRQRLNMKLKRYRYLTKIFVLISIVLFITLFITII